MKKITEVRKSEEVKTLPALELPCHECGSRNYQSVKLIVREEPKTICDGCWHVIPPKKFGKPCKKCGDTKTHQRAGSSDVRPRFVCADCGAFRSVYVVEYGRTLTITAANGSIWTIEFDMFRLILGIGMKQDRISYNIAVQVFSKYHAFKSIIHKITGSSNAPADSWTGKLAAKKSDRAAKRLYPVFSNWWDEYVKPSELVVLAQKKIYSCIGSIPSKVLDNTEIWSSEIALKDMTRTRSACFAFLYYDEEKDKIVKDYNPFFDNEANAQEYADNHFPKPENWMRMFSDKKLPRAARITLANLPGGISARAFSTFFDENALEYIGHPRTTRLEFLAWRRISENSHWGTTRPWVKRVLLAATSEQIKRAYNIYSEHNFRFANVQKMSIRKERNVNSFFSWLADMDEEFTGNSIVKLTEAVAYWHQTMVARRGLKSIERLRIKREFPTLVPIKELPTTEVGELRFLRSAGELLDDYEKMRHCIYTYIPYACGIEKDKTSFIFTLDIKKIVDDKEVIISATAEVSLDGEVIQSRGPRNCSNIAAEELRSILLDWVADWPEQFKLRDKINRISAAYKLLRHGRRIVDLNFEKEIEEIKDYMLEIAEEESIVAHKIVEDDDDFFIF